MVRSFFLLNIYAIATNALVVRKAACPVHLTVSGAVSGPVGQISSGQVRGGEGIISTVFALENGGLIDSNDRGCWWTPPAHVLQCDKGQRPDDGFSISCDGAVAHRGQTVFYECETENGGQHNIYLEPSGGACAQVMLKADSCRADCPPASAQSQPPKACPASLQVPFEYPHLIVHVDKSRPDSSSGASYFGLVSQSTSSIFNFDVPSSDVGKTCSLVFLLPRHEELQTSSYRLSGDGRLVFSWLSEPALDSTTYTNQPDVKRDVGVVTVFPGNGYTVATFDCPAGQRVGFQVSAVGNTNLQYFQDYNPSAVGLYITKC